MLNNIPEERKKMPRNYFLLFTTFYLPKHRFRLHPVLHYVNYESIKALILGHSVPVSPIIPKDIKPRSNVIERNR